MGFKIPKRTTRITFETGDYAGAEVVASLDVGVETYFRYGRMQADAVSADDIEAAFRDFGQLIVSWNLDDDDDRPLPATAENFMTLPPSFCLAVLEQWQQAMTAVPRPLAGPSASGAPLPEVPIPMEALSASPGS